MNTIIKISVDAILHDGNNILLIKRNYDPFKDYLCLPGGMVEYNETLCQAISREVKEETGLNIEFTKKEYFTYFDDPKRDPRFRNITHVFAKKIRLDNIEPLQYDKREVKEIKIIPLIKVDSYQLGFDHAYIIKQYFSQNKKYL